MSDKLRRRRIRRKLARERQGVDWGPMPRVKDKPTPEPAVRVYNELEDPPEGAPDELA